MPSEPRSRYEAIVREQFRTIAAEGRKYGLFLILVSQRVDKVDPLGTLGMWQQGGDAP